MCILRRERKREVDLWRMSVGGVPLKANIKTKYQTQRKIYNITQQMKHFVITDCLVKFSITIKLNDVYFLHCCAVAIVLH